MSEFDERSCPALHPDVAWVEIDGEIVAIDHLSNSVHLIDQRGALLFPLLDGTVSIRELAADVAEVFSVDVDRAVADLLEFMEDISALGLVVVDP